MRKVELRTWMCMFTHLATMWHMTGLAINLADSSAGVVTVPHTSMVSRRLTDGVLNALRRRLIPGRTYKVNSRLVKEKECAPKPRAHLLQPLFILRLPLPLPVEGNEGLVHR
ncbi:hypothetical protein BDW75DRAFT_205265 [Aspergillus navahoensis]